jgi:lambda repressor-like predicted transcriptional regulator
MNKKWTAESVERASWLADLRAQVQAGLDRLAAGREDRRPALEQELRQLRQRIQGWTMSLADPGLSPGVRKTLEANLESALAEQAEAETRLRQAEAEQGQARRVVTATEVADRLNRLAEVLVADDPTRVNIELALHIEAIRGFRDGRVVVRTCKLGALAGDWGFAGASGEPSDQNGTPPGCAYQGKARRLARRRLGGEDAESAGLKDDAEWACDAHRFAGLGPEWFREDEFSIPGPPESWATANALAVARKRREMGWTHAQLAEHFGKSVPTIRAALKLAVEKDPSVASVPRKMPRARWEDSHYEEVAALHRSGMSVRDLSRRFGKSEPLIRAALRLAGEKG